MKKLLLTGVALLFAASTFAQSTMKEDVDIIQAAYGKSKKELVGAYMKIDAAKSAEFWKIYDEYEAERKELGRKKISLINDYAANYETLTEAKADELVKANFKNNADYDKLSSKYYDKMKAVIGSLGAAKFLQLEIYLQTIVRSSIQDAIPFIGEIDKTKK